MKRFQVIDTDETLLRMCDGAATELPLRVRLALPAARSHRRVAFRVPRRPAAVLIVDRLTAAHAWRITAATIVVALRSNAQVLRRPGVRYCGYVVCPVFRFVPTPTLRPVVADQSLVGLGGCGHVSAARAARFGPAVLTPALVGSSPHYRQLRRAIQPMRRSR